MTPKEESKPFAHAYDARELFFQENDATGFNRYDMIVRLLAIENYYGLNNYGWELYRKQQNTRKGEDWQNAESRFRALIESYEANGYDDLSEIKIGSDLRLWDGSHRLALAFYHHHYKISCQVMPTTRNVKYGMDWYLENDFTLDEINKIQDRYLKLEKEIQVPFICTLWAPAAPYFDDIVERLKLVCEVESYQDYTFTEFNYAQMARKIYAVDDIEKWKIGKKIEYMRQNIQDGQWKMRVVKLKLDYPRFRLKASTQNTLSATCEDIKQIIRNCYKNKLPNYFYDIICHIGDNFYQNIFINDLFSFPQNMVANVLKNLEGYDIAIAKFNTPSTPEDFPDSWPLGKDVDIVCKCGQLKAIINTIHGTLLSVDLGRAVIKNQFSSDTRTQVRVELDDTLIYAFDVYCCIDNIDISFFEQLLEHKEKKNSYYVASVPYEIVLRLYEIYHSPEKAHHLDYILKHFEEIDSSLCDKYVSKEVQSVIYQIENGELNSNLLEKDNSQWGCVKYSKSYKYE